MVVIGRRETNATQFPISRSQIAVAIGVSTFIFLLLFRHQFPSFADPPSENLKVDYPSCGSTEKLKSQNARLSSMVTELKKQVSDLNRKLTDQEPIKAGRFGTVKGSPTSPLVFPDETVNPRLAKILSKVAVRRELIVGIANSNVKPTLHLWFTSIKKAGIKNYLVVALDTDTLHFCESNNVPAYLPDPDETLDSLGKMAHSHAVSRLKFRVLREFLQMRYSVLLSDIDIVYIQNPFDHLYRDSDVESMSDGHNNITAYGFDDVFDDPEMGWSRYVHSMRIWVYNSGFFYIRPTVPSIELLDRVVSVMERDEEAWDQTVFNEELFYPSSPGYVGLHASKRTMDMYLFMNSKVLFRRVRKDKGLKKMKPVVVHVNYHPNKVPRMRGVYEFYVDGKEDALDSFSDAEKWNPN